MTVHRPGFGFFVDGSVGAMAGTHPAAAAGSRTLVVSFGAALVAPNLAVVPLLQPRNVASPTLKARTGATSNEPFVDEEPRP